MIAQEVRGKTDLWCDNIQEKCVFPPCCQLSWEELIATIYTISKVWYLYDLSPKISTKTNLALLYLAPDAILVLKTLVKINPASNFFNLNQIMKINEFFNFQFEPRSRVS